MALAYDANVQAQIVYRLVGRAYSTLSTEDKAALDGTWSSGSLARGHAHEALRLLHRYANFLQVDLDTAPPDDWMSWWIWETVWRASHHIVPEREDRAKKHRDDALRLALATHTRSGHEETDQTQGWTITHAALRGFVLDVCIHMDPPFLPSPEMVDGAMRSRFAKLWTYANWLFRRTPVVLTIATDGTVTSSPSVTIDAVTSRKLYYSDTEGAGMELCHASASDMARLRALGLDDGRPEYFRLTKSAGTLSWEFERTPDQSYTARAEVVTALPALASAANFNTAVALLPSDMLDLLRTAIASDVSAMGMDPSRGRLQREEMERLWTDSLGRMDAVGEPPKLGAASHTRGAFHSMFANNMRRGPVVGGNL